MFLVDVRFERKIKNYFKKGRICSCIYPKDMVSYHGNKGRSSVKRGQARVLPFAEIVMNAYKQEENSMDLIKELTKSQLKELPPVLVGDTVRVHVKVKEGARERIQVYEGTVIAKKHGGIEETVTVRRMSYGVGVEKVFPLHSPTIDKIEVVRHGVVRRAKLYYLRDRVGKAAKVREKL